MKRFLNIFLLYFGIFLMTLQSCIHEHPATPLVQNPEITGTQIEISFNLYWERLLEIIEFDTRDREENGNHKFLIEIKQDGKIINRDTRLLTDYEFELGSFVYETSLPIGQYNYEIGVWYEKQAEDGNHYFNVENLSAISFTSSPPLHLEWPQCAYASEKLVLPAGPEIGQKIYKKVEMNLAGARFEIVTTDVQKFIEDHRASLAQGDTFSLNLLLHNNSSYYFNLYNEKADYLDEPIVLSGELFLPFTNEEEMTIARGFIFCLEEDVITMSLNVYNSARMLVTQTDDFSFPAKRGYITTLRGDFLTNYMEGIFSIDNIWEGEFVLEL